MRAIIVVVAVLIALYIWHATFIQKCVNWNSEGLFGLSSFVQQGCPPNGPYEPENNVWLWALLHPFD